MAPPAPPAGLDLAPFALPLRDRWVLAARIAHRLAEPARAVGAFATAEVRVAVGRRAPRRPAVAVVPGALPVQPLVRRAPLLVVELAPVCDPAAWLALGVAAVWSVGPESAWVSTPDGPPRPVPAPGRLELAVAGAGARAVLALALPVQDAPSASAPVACAPGAVAVAGGGPPPGGPGGPIR